MVIFYFSNKKITLIYLWFSKTHYSRKSRRSEEVPAFSTSYVIKALPHHISDNGPGVPDVAVPGRFFYIIFKHKDWQAVCPDNRCLLSVANSMSKAMSRRVLREHHVI